MKDRMKIIDELCESVAGMSMRCDDDLCGEQREYYNPRISKATSALIKLYPQQFLEAVARTEN